MTDNERDINTGLDLPHDLPADAPRLEVPAVAGGRRKVGRPKGSTSTASGVVTGLTAPVESEFSSEFPDDARIEMGSHFDAPLQISSNVQRFLDAHDAEPAFVADGDQSRMADAGWRPIRRGKNNDGPPVSIDACGVKHEIWQKSRDAQAAALETLDKRTRPEPKPKLLPEAAMVKQRTVRGGKVTVEEKRELG